MASRKTPDSPAYVLLEHVWQYQQRATSGYSDNRERHVMADAMRLAIDGGLVFAEGDFDRASKAFLGVGFHDERLYALAVATGNLSAARSYEAWTGRVPIIADDVEPHAWPNCSVSTRRRQRGRLAVGFTFPWAGVRVTATSFNDAADPPYLVACSYYHDAPYPRKVARRFKITASDVQDFRKAKKDFAREHES